MFYTFTKEDGSLLGAVSGRDPLGILPVWQYRARDVVPHLAAASRELAGFHLLLVALAWWPKFAKDHNQPARNIDKYFLLVEQAFARACNTIDGQWPLPGTRRLGSDKGVWISLDPAHHLLGGQLANGTWGIYRSPAISAGFIDENNVVIGELAADIVSQTGFMSRLLPSVFKAMQGDHIEWVAERANHQLVKELSAFIKEYPLAPLVQKPLLDPPTHAVTRHVVALMRQQAKADFDVEAFVLAAMTAIPDYEAVFRQIMDCERYLAAVESAFEWLCSTTVASVKEAGDQLPVNMAALRAANKRFRNSGDYGLNTLAAQRKGMMENLDLTSRESFVRSLVQLHGEVSTSRGNDPWISIQETGQLDVRVATGKPDDDRLDPATSWRNGYYLPTLFNLVRQFHAAGGRK